MSIFRRNHFGIRTSKIIINFSKGCGGVVFRYAAQLASHQATFLAEGPGATGVGCSSLPSILASFADAKDSRWPSG
jgi:hypothetical protein